VNILILSTEFPPGPGGIGAHAFALAYGFQKLGHAVTVHTSQDFAPREEIVEFNSSQPFAVFSLRRSRYSFHTVLRAGREFRKAIRARHFDLVIASGARSLWLGFLIGSPASFPWVALGHGSEFATSTRWRCLLTHLACERANLVVCVSHYTLKRLLSTGTRPRRTEVIPNGADSQCFYPRKNDAVASLRRQLGVSGKLLLTVGNVNERKGQDVVIRALPRLIEQLGDVDYAIVGLPTHKERLTQMARRLEVEDRVHFLGRIDKDKLADAYNSCDLFLMTSRHSTGGDFEGYGIAVIEAALCGKAAIVTGGSGLEEAVVHRKTGLVVPEDDPEATALAVIELFTNIPFLDRLEEQARARALEKLTSDHMVRSYMRAVEPIVSGRARNELARR
jgi:phosphatidylinositol alpha-1,6-mannosyltransferase